MNNIAARYREVIYGQLLTSVHVNRILKEMEAKGWIHCQSKRLTILDEEALMKTGQFDPGMISKKSLILGSEPPQ
jgi:hypothetical protein